MKKTIRLTENDLHNIIKESVKQIVNEIGDTPKGQYMLGRLAAKQHAYDVDSTPASKYAEKRVGKKRSIYGTQPFNHGWMDQRDYDSWYKKNQEYADNTLKANMNQNYNKYKETPNYPLDGSATKYVGEWGKENPRT